jgi:hypothetical protein
MKIYFVAASLIVSIAATAQRDSLPSPAAPRPGGTPGASRSGPRSFREIITDKAVSRRGLFTVHKIDEKYYFEIPDSLFSREILSVTRYTKVPSNSNPFGRGVYGGELANDQTLIFEKGPGNNVFLRVLTLVNTADTSNVIYKAVVNSNVNAITAAFPVAAFGRDSLSVVIDVTDFFKGDNQVVSIRPAVKRGLGLTALATDRSFIQKINSYPLNIEIRTVKTFISSGNPGAPGVTAGPTIPAANDAGAVTIELNTSLLLLPKTPMATRIWDPRVGYFWDEVTNYADVQQKVNATSFITRWRLEPREEDVEKWKRGEMVEPKKQIVYYIDPATPKQWRKYLILGINDWQTAFEKAGFKNAIIGKEWPENDTTMSMEDARYSVVRYFASDVSNAYGPNVHDPRSGEILESHIGWYHNVMTILHDWYMVQTAAVDPRSRKMKFEDELMGDLIRFVSSHEVGHTLGLLHNMGNSSKTPVEKLRDKAWVEANGHTGSIMDYARFNYVAQPEDNISKEGLYPRIGDYDKWAMRWGYGYIPGTTLDELKANSNKLITEALKNNPRNWFGTYELGNASDPRSQSEDLSDNAVKASEYGIKNLQRVLLKLPEWTREEADLNTNLGQMYTQVLGQFRRYMGHVSRNIGGVYETIRSVEDNEPVYEITPKNIQRESTLFLNKQVFQTPSWLVAKDYLNKFNNPSTADPVANTQEAVLASLINFDRLNRLQISLDRFGTEKAYNAIDFLSDIQNDLFIELKNHKPTDLHRRMLQKSYVDRLNGMLNPAAPVLGQPTILQDKRGDVQGIVRSQLTLLKIQVSAAIGAMQDKMTKIHLQELSERIKRSLDPK